MQKDIVITNSKLTGITSGIAELDKLTNRWQDSNLIVFAAHPNMGKTALMLTIAVNMACGHNIPVAIFSLEMSNTQIINRLLSNISEIKREKIKSGDLTDSEQKHIETNIKILRNASMYIDDTANITITALEFQMRQLAQNYQVKYIFIDYLQLVLGCENNLRFRSRQDEIELIMKRLSDLANELDILIIVLYEFSKGIDKNRKDKSPCMRDFGEMSGIMKQYIDGIYFLHRPEYYLPYQKEDSRHLCRLVGILKVSSPDIALQ